MTEQTQAPAAEQPRRKVTLREMRQRAEDAAYERRGHHAVMTKLAADPGPPFAADPEEIAIAEAFESIARVIDWLLRDDAALLRLKDAAERGEV
jgi:hypothetical protein